MIMNEKKGMIRMTRFELDIAGAVKKVKQTGRVYAVLKVKTKENYIYTLKEYKFEPETHSERSLFEHVLSVLTYEMEELRNTMLSDKAIYIYEEGRILNADNIKEIWYEFDICDRACIGLDGENSIK